MAAEDIASNLCKGVMKQLQFIFLFFLLMGFQMDCLYSQEDEIINKNNEYGGKTVEIIKKDFSFMRAFYDDENSKIKEEQVFSSEYPINNGLKKIITYFSFNKIVKVERVFTQKIARNTLIAKTIDHFDRFTGNKIKSENRFIESYPGYNVIYRKKGKRVKIEWLYPQNIEGIIKNVVFYNDDEIGVRVESFYAKKTSQDTGYLKRIYYNDYSAKKYLRKIKEEWYFTDEFSKENGGIHHKVYNYHYSADQPVIIEAYIFDKEGNTLSSEFK